MGSSDRRSGLAQASRFVLMLSLLAAAPARGQQHAVVQNPSATASHATAPRTGAVRVSVRLVDARGAVVPARDAVVWVDGLLTGPPPAKGEAVAQVAQRKKTFVPHVEVLRVGSTVAFPNLDRIYHNVFSLSEIAPFDLGLYRNGASRSLAFPRPGIVRIYCNIHPSMSAFLVVVNSDVFGKTAADGSVELPDVPVGTWPVSAWHEKGGEGQARVTVEPGRTQGLDLRLDASGWRPHPHRNKYGKDYPPPDDDENRY
jgi:plastocyanin